MGHSTASGRTQSDQPRVPEEAMTRVTAEQMARIEREARGMRDRDLVKTLENLYDYNRAETSGPLRNSPEMTVSYFVNNVGEEAAIRTIASLVNQASWDGRISDRNKEWARSVPGALTAEEANRSRVFTDKIHKSHLDQLASVARRRAWAGTATS